MENQIKELQEKLKIKEQECTNRKIENRTLTAELKKIKLDHDNIFDRYNSKRFQLEFEEAENTKLKDILQRVYKLAQQCYSDKDTDVINNCLAKIIEYCTPYQK